jgi:hypothetical protein
MSLPMGRGSRQVRSCGLVRKRDARGRAAKVRYLEREIRARFSAVLLSRDSKGNRNGAGQVWQVSASIVV